MADPVTVGEYVTGGELVAVLKLAAGDLARADTVAAAANLIVFQAVGQAGANAYLAPPVEPATYPAAAREAALAIAVDLWRRPKSPGGVFQVADYVGRLALDPVAPVMVLISTMRLSWPIA